jgi:hypothetical protein
VRRRAYAITSAQAAAPRIRGMTSEPLRVVRAAGLGVIVGGTARLTRPSARQVTSYHAVLQRLWRAFPAILPLRFGTIVDDEALPGLMRERAREWRPRLRLVRGRAQMTVRVIDAGVRREGAEGRGPRAASGAAYLRARAQRAARADSRDVLAPVRRSVDRWIRAERLERRGAVITAYHLVPRRSVPSYRRALVAAGVRAHLRIHVTGPFAPYAFAEEPLPFD